MTLHIPEVSLPASMALPLSPIKSASGTENKLHENDDTSRRSAKAPAPPKLKLFDVRKDQSVL